MTRFDISSTHQVGDNRKRCQPSTNVDQKSIETVFSIAICCQWGDKMAIKNTVSIDFYLRSSIVLAFSIAASPVCSSQFITGSTHIMGGYIYFPTVLIKFYYQCLCVSGHSGLHDQSVQMPLPAPMPITHVLVCHL